MPVDISDFLCLPSAGVNVGIRRWCSGASFPGPNLTVDEIDTLAKVVEVAAVELAEQITRCSSLQSGFIVQLTMQLHIQRQHLVMMK